MVSTSVVVPNWNGKNSLGDCLDSIQNQSLPAAMIVVDNGSSDGSAEFVAKNYPQAVLIRHKKNKGFAGGVNAGIKKALDTGAKYVALLNNDAVAESGWLKALAEYLDKHPKTGIATSKILDSSGRKLDSTGDYYTIWGLPYPRGRGEIDIKKYDNDTEVFGASGGASLYRTEMLREIGLFDEDFFAYYEDVDLSFRAQLAGWKVAYVPKAIVRHEISATSSKMGSFATYQTLKNLPMLMWKNVPLRLMPKVWPRLALAYAGMTTRTILRGQIGAFFKGTIVGSILLPKKFAERSRIQRSRKVSVSYIDSIMVHDLPPNAGRLRALRSKWRRLVGRRS